MIPRAANIAFHVTEFKIIFQEKSIFNHLEIFKIIVILFDNLNELISGNFIDSTKGTSFGREGLL